MASREIYANGFDEDVQTDNQTNGCPEYGGRVATNTVETVCEACGLVLEEHAIEHSGEPVYEEETLQPCRDRDQFTAATQHSA